MISANFVDIQLSNRGIYTRKCNLQCSNAQSPMVCVCVCPVENPDLI